MASPITRYEVHGHYDVDVAVDGPVASDGVTLKAGDLAEQWPEDDPIIFERIDTGHVRVRFTDIDPAYGFDVALTAEQWDELVAGLAVRETV